MNIESLSLFLEVMLQKSFTRVARNHDIAPSSVSRTIAKLEEELGVRLFQRSTRKLEATEAGVAYYERVNPIIKELEAAKQIATDISKEPRGTLRISAPVVYGKAFIVPLLSAFLDKNPLLKIDLVLNDAYVDLIEERIDIAIRLGTLQDSSHIARKLKDMKFFVCASPDYIKKYGRPRSPLDVQDHNCLVFPRTGYNTNWIFKNSSKDTTELFIKGNCTITNSEAIKQSTIAGMGLSLLPDWLVEDDIKKEALIRLFSNYETTATDYESAVWLMYPSRDYVPLKTQVFIDYLVSSSSN